MKLPKVSGNSGCQTPYSKAIGGGDLFIQSMHCTVSYRFVYPTLLNTKGLLVLLERKLDLEWTIKCVTVSLDLFRISSHLIDVDHGLKLADIAMSSWGTMICFYELPVCIYRA